MAFQAQTSRPPGGYRAWRTLGPSVKRLRIDLADLMPTSQIFAASPSPDYVKLSTAGTASAATHGAALSMMGLLEEQVGRHVAYLGNVAQVSDNAATSMILDPRQVAMGLLVEPGSLTIVRGNEASNEVLTLQGAILETEP